tara:strand:- start:3176 stop:3418 length:243 start_codon:yes stop_codon:yes gene_type:complete
MTTILSKEGILYKKDYSTKLEFKFVHLNGEKFFEFKVLKLKSWEGIVRTYEKNEGKIYFMKEEEFINYLYNAGYLDNKEL